MFNERVGKQVESKTLVFSHSSSLSILHTRLSNSILQLGFLVGEYMYILLLGVSVSHVVISGLPGLFLSFLGRVDIFFRIVN